METSGSKLLPHIFSFLLTAKSGASPTFNSSNNGNSASKPPRPPPTLPQAPPAAPPFRPQMPLPGLGKFITTTIYMYVWVQMWKVKLQQPSILTIPQKKNLKEEAPVHACVYKCQFQFLSLAIFSFIKASFFFSFSGFSVGFCINQRGGYLLPT